MLLTDLNRDGGIGANCNFIRLGNFRLVVDSGFHPKKSGLDVLPDFKPLDSEPPDLLLITHCHLDHLGSTPVLLRRFPETTTLISETSLILAPRMMHNSCNVMMRQREEQGIPEYPLYTHGEIERTVRKWLPMRFGQRRVFDIGSDSLDITFHPSGHIPGAAGVELVHNHQRIFLTGDVSFQAQQILPGAAFPNGHADILVTETTRGGTSRAEHASRASEVQRLLADIAATINNGGSVLIPVFALGRMQEILALLHQARRQRELPACPIFASGLGMELCDYFDEIARKNGQVRFRRRILKELGIQPMPEMRPGRPPSIPALYVVSSGMMVEHTPSYLCAASLIGEPSSLVAWVGYCDPDTPGGKLQATPQGQEFLFETLDYITPVHARRERYDLSGHADREELLDFALRMDPRAIILTHGDPEARAWFADELPQHLPQARILDPRPGSTVEA